MKFFKYFFILNFILHLNNIFCLEFNKNYAINKRKLNYLKKQFDKKRNLQNTSLTSPELASEIKELDKLIKFFSSSMFDDLSHYNKNNCPYLQPEKEQELTTRISQLHRSVHAEIIRLGLIKTNNYEISDKIKEKRNELIQASGLLDDYHSDSFNYFLYFNEHKSIIEKQKELSYIEDYLKYIQAFYKQYNI